MFRKTLCTIKVLLPTDAQENCFKSSVKMYTKTAPTCFLYSPSSGSALYEFAKATILNRQLKYIGVVNLVLWLHVLSGPWWCMSAHSSEPVKKSLCIVVYFFFNYILLQAAVRFQWLWRLKLWLTSEAQMPFEVWTIFTSFLCSYFSVSVGREKYSYVDTTR